MATDGFVVATDADWTTLTNYLISQGTTQGVTVGYNPLDDVVITADNVGDALKSHRQVGSPLIVLDNEHVFDYIPENFEGVKIAQSFSFINPIGYTPKFTIDTMRVVIADKTFLDTIHATYGLESDVTLEILKLNAVGTAYEAIYTFNFAIDFESYEVFDVYSEFALKSISVIDDYNLIKNTEIQLALSSFSEITANLNLINKVYLKSYTTTLNLAYLEAAFNFINNGDSEVFNKDSSLFPDDSVIYHFGGNETTPLVLSFNAGGLITVVTSFLMTSAKIVICLNNSSTELYTLVTSAGNGYSKTMIIPSSFSLPPRTYNAGDQIILLVKFPTDDYGAGTATISGTVQLNLKYILNEYIIPSGENVSYLSINDILGYIYNGKFTSDISENLSLTSANSLLGISNYANFKPKDFVSDICLFTGSILNYKLNGNVDVKDMDAYFDNMLTIGNAIEITDFKDLSIKQNTDFNFVSVEVGSEPIDYDIYLYSKNWNKTLTFKQVGRVGSENLELKPTKIKNDFSLFSKCFLKSPHFQSMQ